MTNYKQTTKMTTKIHIIAVFLLMLMACKSSCFVEANHKFRIFSNKASFVRKALDQQQRSKWRNDDVTMTTRSKIFEIRGGSSPSVLTKNSLWSLATLLYVKACVTICDTLMNRQVIPADVSRKIIHLAACSWCLFWPRFDASHWSWKLNIAIPALYSIQLFVKGAIVQDANDRDVKTMSRTGDPKELLYGPLMFTLVMMVCGLQFYRKPCGTYIMGSLVGDGLAPLVGKRYPKGAYKTYGGETKTVSGSLGMWVGSVLGILVYSLMLGVPKDIDFPFVVLVALVATIAEGISGIWDNPVIALTVYGFVKATNKL